VTPFRTNRRLWPGTLVALVRRTRGHHVRIRIVRAPAGQSIGAIRLDAYRVGQTYDVDPSVASLLIDQGWAERVDRPADDLLRESNPQIDRLRSGLRREGEPPLFDGAGPDPEEPRRSGRRPPKPHE